MLPDADMLMESNQADHREDGQPAVVERRVSCLLHEKGDLVCVLTLLFGSHFMAAFIFGVKLSPAVSMSTIIEI